MFHVFGSVAEFGKIIRDRTMARLELARVRGRHGSSRGGRARRPRRITTMVSEIARLSVRGKAQLHLEAGARQAIT
jgi:hypothetical protein